MLEAAGGIDVVTPAAFVQRYVTNVRNAQKGLTVRRRVEQATRSLKQHISSSLLSGQANLTTAIHDDT